MLVDLPIFVMMIERYSHDIFNSNQMPQRERKHKKRDYKITSKISRNALSFHFYREMFQYILSLLYFIVHLFTPSFHFVSTLILQDIILSHECTSI